MVLQLPDEADLLAVFWACQLGGLVPVPVAATPPPGSRLSAADLLAAACRVADRPWVVTSAAAGTLSGPARERHRTGQDPPWGSGWARSRSCVPARPPTTSTRRLPTIWPPCC
ncbi:hypothetical protein ACWV95_00955 [Streptomyces albus]